MILTYGQRQAYWNWCREFIDREAIYRVDDTHPQLLGKDPTGNYTFQFYLRRATFNAEFAYRLGLLFWDHFLPAYQQQPFNMRGFVHRSIQRPRPSVMGYPGNDPIRPHRHQFPRRAHSPPEARELAVSSGTER